MFVTGVKQPSLAVTSKYHYRLIRQNLDTQTGCQSVLFSFNQTSESWFFKSVMERNKAKELDTMAAVVVAVLYQHSC